MMCLMMALDSRCTEYLVSAQRGRRKLTSTESYEGEGMVRAIVGCLGSGCSAI